MNKYEEALKSFEEAYRNVTQDDSLTNEKRDALQELIDKETPVQPKRFNYPYSLDVGCGKCGGVFSTVKHTFCPYCGQKVDWGE